jgi:hypothetical protein
MITIPGFKRDGKSSREIEKERQFCQRKRERKTICKKSGEE